MNHRQASKHIVEWVDGTLEPAVAEDVERHVARCSKCGEISRLYRMMRRVAAHGRSGGPEDGPRGPDGPGGPDDPVVDGHPPDAKLYMYALGTHRWDPADVAAIEAHLDGCDRCRAEVEAIRAAQFSASAGESFRDRAAGFLRGSVALPGPAIVWIGVGLLVAAFGWTAWRQVRPLRQLIAVQERSLTELRAESDALRASADRARERVQALERVRTGAARVLMLPRILRSGAPDRVPSVPAQAWTHVVQAEIDLGGERGALDPQFYATVRAASTDQVVWTLKARRGEFWNAEDGLATFLIPGDALPPGDYRFELRARDAAGSGLAWPFRIGPAADGESQTPR